MQFHTFFRRFLILSLFIGLAICADRGLMQADSTAYTAEDGSIHFSYPNAWILDDKISSMGVILTNNQATLDAAQSSDGTIPAGGLLVMVSSSAEGFIDLSDTVYAHMSALDLVGALADDLVKTNGDNQASHEEPILLTVSSGYEAASVAAINREINADALIYVLNTGTTKGVVVAYSHLGEMPTFEPKLAALVDTIQFKVQPPPKPTTVSVEATLTYGSTVEGEVTDIDTGIWTFSGTAGDAVTLKVTSDTDTELTLLDPTGAMLTYDDDSGGNYNPLLSAVPLPTSGVYTVEVSSSLGDSGTFTLTLDKAKIVPPTPIKYGATVTGVLKEPQGDRWSFMGHKGDIVSVKLDAEFDNQLELRDSANEVLTQDDDSGGNGNAAIAGFALPKDGIYTLVARAYDVASISNGAYTLTLNTIDVPTPGKIAYGDFVSTVMYSTDGDHWTFDGKAGDTVGIAAIGAFSTMIDLYGPDQSVLASNDHALGQFDALIDSFTLPADGEYTIVVQSYSGGMGQYALMLGQSAELNTGARGRK